MIRIRAFLYIMKNFIGSIWIESQNIFSALDIPTASLYYITIFY